jgi:hypothetical protein
MKSEYIVAVFFVVFGIICLVFKPVFEVKKNINPEKFAVYQGYAMILFGLYFIILQSIQLSLLMYAGGIIAGIAALILLTPVVKKKCRITEEEAGRIAWGKYKRRAKKTGNATVIFAVGFTVSMFVTMMIRPKIAVTDDKFKVSGEFGFDYPLSDIVEIDTVQGFPKTGLMLGGSGFGRVYKGRFELRGYGTGRLFVKKGIPPYIFIKFKNDDLIFMNMSSSKETVEFYENLKSKINVE